MSSARHPPLATTASRTTTADESTTTSPHHQIAVDLSGQSGESDGHVAGPAESGQAVQRAGGADEVIDLDEVGRPFELMAVGREVSRCCSGPGSGLEAAGLAQDRWSLSRRRPAGAARS
jgi:hypothetical protein